MRATYDLNTNGVLTLTVTDAERAELKEMSNEYSSTSAMEYDVLDSMLCNSMLTWVDPAETGDLTSAPMLGLRNEKGEVMARWAFMDYQIRSFVDDLIDKGKAVFVI